MQHNLKNHLTLSALTLLGALLLHSCKLKVNADADNISKKASEVIQQVDIKKDNATESADETSSLSTCEQIQQDHSKLFESARKTPASCSTDADCTVLSGFTGDCEFAAIAKDDMTTMASFAALLKKSKAQSCEFGKCMTLRAFEAVCKEKKCALK